MPYTIDVINNNIIHARYTLPTYEDTQLSDEKCNAILDTLNEASIVFSVSGFRVEKELYANRGKLLERAITTLKRPNVLLVGVVGFPGMFNPLLRLLPKDVSKKIQIYPDLSKFIFAVEHYGEKVPSNAESREAKRRAQEEKEAGKSQTTSS